jgi:fucose permease
MFGLVILRYIVFASAIHKGNLNLSELNIASLLFTLGLGIGSPIIVGVLLESNLEKLKNANIVLNTKNKIDKYRQGYFNLMVTKCIILPLNYLMALLSSQNHGTNFGNRKTGKTEFKIF